MDVAIHWRCNCWNRSIWTQDSRLFRSQFLFRQRDIRDYLIASWSFRRRNTQSNTVISTLGLEAGILADPLSIIMTNLVAWVSFLIFVYSIGYMHGDRDLTRFWFFMLFFIGSMQLIVLSDNLLMVFFGWEGVGLASCALIGFWYHDRKKDYVGREGELQGYHCGHPDSCRYEGVSNDQSRRYNDARWNVSHFCVCRNLRV